MLHRTHAEHYRRTDGLRRPACNVRTHWIGIVHEPALRRKIALFQCRACNSLIWVAEGVVIRELEPGPAAIPVGSEVPRA